jgi:hypothetical protein
MNFKNLYPLIIIRKIRYGWIHANLKDHQDKEILCYHKLKILSFSTKKLACKVNKFYKVKLLRFL